MLWVLSPVALFLVLFKRKKGHGIPNELSDIDAGTEKTALFRHD
jgi:hypothetical protein